MAVIACYILWFVAQAGVVAFCIYRCLSLGRAFERELGQRYPALAQKRRAHPFYRLTLPGMLLPGQLTQEPELHEDVSLRRKREAVYAYFVGACLTIILPQLVVLVVRRCMG